MPVSMVIQFAALAVPGAPPLGVLAFEVQLNATSMFNHGNVRLPPWLDCALRLLLVRIWLGVQLLATGTSALQAPQGG